MLHSVENWWTYMYYKHVKVQVHQEGGSPIAALFPYSPLWCVPDHRYSFKSPFLLAKTVDIDFTCDYQKESPFLASVETTLASRFSPAPDMCHISFTSFVKSRGKNSVFVVYNSLFIYFCFTAQQLGKIQHTMYVYQSPYIYCIGWLAGVAVHVFV